jgi:rhamnosyltransferase
LEITVVIRTRDEEKHLDSLLKSLSIQTLLPSQLVIVDNYSNEAERDHLKNCLIAECRQAFKDKAVEVKLMALSDDEFSHAYSTNLGVAASDHELVCITNAHSLPISEEWLETGVDHFKNPEIAGVSGYFFPHHQSTFFAKVDKATYQFTQKSILHQNWCSTVNCIIRKSLWKIYSFDENLPNVIPGTKKYGLEDYDWSREMVARSFKILVDPAFSVFHSHDNSWRETVRNLRRYFIYRRLQSKINSLERPRVSFTSVLGTRRKRSIVEWTS